MIRILTLLSEPSFPNVADMIQCCQSRGRKYYDMPPQQPQNRKLYKLLSTRHMDCSNSRHLNAELGEENTPSSLSEVLHCNTRCSSETVYHHTFELIKTCMVPELFAIDSCNARILSTSKLIYIFTLHRLLFFDSHHQHSSIKLLRSFAEVCQGVL